MTVKFTTASSALAAFAIAAGLVGCGSTPPTGVEEKINLWPLVVYETRTNPEGHQVDFLWPLGAHWREGDVHGSRALPLWFDETDAEGERTTDVLLFYWQQHAADDSSVSRVLFPFFWWKRSPDVDRTAFWPLFGRTENKREHTNSGFALWPLSTWESGGERASSSFAFVEVGKLLSLFGRSHTFRDVAKPASAPAASEPTAESHVVEERDTHVLSLLDPKVALFSQRSSTDSETGARTEHTHFFPLQWHTRDEAGGFSMLLPFYLGWQNADSSTREFWLPPLFGREHDPAKDLVATDVLWPLVRSETWREENGEAWHFRFLPFAWFTKRPNSDVSLLLPFWYRVRDPANEYEHIVPLWGHHLEDHGRREKTFIVPPLFVRTTDKDGHLERNEVLWPLTSFEHADDHEHIVPLWGHHLEDHGRREKTFIVPPLFVRTTDKDGHLERNEVLWPLTSFEHADDHEASRVFPLWWWSRAAHTAHLNVLGVFDRQESEIAARWMLWPLYSSVDKEGVGRRTAILPVFDVVRHGVDPNADEDSTSVLWPISSFEKRGASFARWVFPFVWWFDDGVNHSHRHVWPLIGFDEEGSLHRVSTLWPFFWSGSSNDGARGDWHFLWPLGGGAWNEQESCSRFFPLWLHESYPNTGHSDTWFLWPLVNVRKDQDGVAEWSFLWRGLRYERASGVEDFRVLHALYHSHVEGARSSWSVPLLIGYENDGGAKTLRLLLIPIHWGEKSSG